MKTREEVLKDVMKCIEDNYDLADCGLYFTRNIVGDPMETIFEEEGVTVDICYYYSYYEVFGLTKEEEKIIKDYYDSLDSLRYMEG